MSVESALKEEKVKYLNLPPPVCVERDLELRKVIELMQSERRGCVLVCDGNQVIGIFTERDLLTQVMGQPVNYNDPIEKLMVSRPECLTWDHTVLDVIRLMSEGGYRHIPLKDESDGVNGMISARDVVHFIVDHYPVEVYNLPPNPDQLHASPEGA